jgi:cytochrome c oxidase subunit 2
MNMKKAALVVLAAMMCSSAFAAGDAAAGKASYVVCVSCHGENGEGNRGMNSPKIAGQEAWYLTRQLNAYKNEHRGTAEGDTFGMQMRPMAMTLANDEAVANVVAYIGTLPVAPSPVTVEGDAAAGKAGYLGCAACHGANAEGNEQMGGPGLVGQNDWYLVNQMKAYQNGHRGYASGDTFGMQMKPMAATLPSDKAINDVVAYINSLQ